MGEQREPRDLEELIARMEEAAHESDRVSVDSLMSHVGRRSFGPLLLVAGLVTLAPVVGDIPGVPTIAGLFVLLVSVQLLLGRDQFWMPQVLLRRSLASRKLSKALDWMRRPARFVDRLLRPRLQVWVGGAGLRAIAVVSIVIAAATPAMEVVPFSANFAGAALTAFGLALIARDGLFALIAFALTGLMGGLVAYNLL